MEKLLQKQNCKPITGLNLFCKLILGLLTKNCKLILGRDINQILVFQIKFCGKSPALRVAAKRLQ